MRARWVVCRVLRVAAGQTLRRADIGSGVHRFPVIVSSFCGGCCGGWWVRVLIGKCWTFSEGVCSVRVWCCFAGKPWCFLRWGGIVPDRAGAEGGFARWGSGLVGLRSCRDDGDEVGLTTGSPVSERGSSVWVCFFPLRGGSACEDVSVCGVRVVCCLRTQ